MPGREMEDESAQFASVYCDVQALFQDALSDGYDHHAIAEALLEGARDVLADNTEFLTVLERFKLRRNI